MALITCPACGAQVSSRIKACPKCGASLIAEEHSSESQKETAASDQEEIHEHHYQKHTYHAPAHELSFFEYIKKVFKNYNNFKGRARRKEYWYFSLFNFIITQLIIICLNSSSLISAIWFLSVITPSIAVCTRRLHDVGRSGWWQLISLTIVGAIPLILWLVTDGDPIDNEYGPNPKQRHS